MSNRICQMSLITNIRISIGKVIIIIFLIYSSNRDTFQFQEEFGKAAISMTFFQWLLNSLTYLAAQILYLNTDNRTKNEIKTLSFRQILQSELSLAKQK